MYSKSLRTGIDGPFIDLVRWCMMIYYSNKVLIVHSKLLKEQWVYTCIQRKKWNNHLTEGIHILPMLLGHHKAMSRQPFELTGSKEIDNANSATFAFAGFLEWRVPQTMVVSILIWLVVSNPLKNISRLGYHVESHKIHVPNHQPESHGNPWLGWFGIPMYTGNPHLTRILSMTRLMEKPSNTATSHASAPTILWFFFCSTRFSPRLLASFATCSVYLKMTDTKILNMIIGYPLIN